MGAESLGMVSSAGGGFGEKDAGWRSTGGGALQAEGACSRDRAKWMKASTKMVAKTRRTRYRRARNMVNECDREGSNTRLGKTKGKKSPKRKESQMERII